MTLFSRYPVNNKFEVDFTSSGFDLFNGFKFSLHPEIDPLVTPLPETNSIYLRPAINTDAAKSKAFTLLKTTQIGLQILYLDATIADINLQVLCAKQRVSKFVLFDHKDKASLPELEENASAELQYLALKYFHKLKEDRNRKDLDLADVEEVENFLDHTDEAVRRMASVIYNCYVIAKGTIFYQNLSRQCNSLIADFMEHHTDVSELRSVPFTFLIIHLAKGKLTSYDPQLLTTTLKITDTEKQFLNECYRDKTIINAFLKSGYLNNEKKYFDFYFPFITKFQQKLFTHPNATLTDEDIDSLVAEIGPVDAQSQKKGKAPSTKKGSSSKQPKKPPTEEKEEIAEKQEGSSSSKKPPIRQKTLPEKEQVLLDHFNGPNKSSYHPRVSRWFLDSKSAPEKIREFPDYKDYSDLNYAHAIHAFPEIEKIRQHAELGKIYTKTTKRGFTLQGELHFRGKVTTGVFQFGADKDTNIIFHRVFHTLSTDEIRNNKMGTVQEVKDGFYDKLAPNQTYVRNTKITLQKTGKIFFEDDSTGIKCAIMPNPN